jgi:hypothetical protein
MSSHFILSDHRNWSAASNWSNWQAWMLRSFPWRKPTELNTDADGNPIVGAVR